MSDILGQFLPRYGQREVHSILLAAPPEQVWAAMLQVTPAELPLPRALMAIRGLPARLRGGGRGLMHDSRPLAEIFRQDGRWVTLLERPGRILVVGRAATFWRAVPQGKTSIRRPEDFMAFNESGFAKAVISHEILPEGEGSRLVTETRVQAIDPRSRRLFAAYWFLIRPGVGMIRRSVLRAVDRRVETA